VSLTDDPASVADVLGLLAAHFTTPPKGKWVLRDKGSGARDVALRHRTEEATHPLSCRPSHFSSRVLPLP
jgi:hypothetical protein